MALKESSDRDKTLPFHVKLCSQEGESRLPLFLRNKDLPGARFLRPSGARLPPTPSPAHCH